MTEPSGLAWLTVGETAAYISARFGCESVTEATVEKIGKRDVLVTVAGRSEKFNINNTTMRGTGTWLHRRGSSSWDRGVHLAPLTDPAVIEIRAREAIADAAGKVRSCADAFQRDRDVASALKLRAAVDTFLALHDVSSEPAPPSRKPRSH